MAKGGNAIFELPMPVVPVGIGYGGKMEEAKTAAVGQGRETAISNREKSDVAVRGWRLVWGVLRAVKLRFAAVIQQGRSAVIE